MFQNFEREFCDFRARVVLQEEALCHSQLRGLEPTGHQPHQLPSISSTQSEDHQFKVNSE
jgi:hypothetical protein